MQFLPPTGHSYREGTKWAKGHLYALMGHLAFHIRALRATAEPGICPREPYSLPLTVRHKIGKAIFSKRL